MSVRSANQNIISEGYTLASDIIQLSKDSIEKTIKRKENIAGSLIGSLFFAPVLAPGVFFLSDAGMDRVKLNSISGKRLDLKNRTNQLNSQESDYNHALISVEFQDTVYGNVEKYTHAARKAKLIAGSCFAVAGLSLLSISLAPLFRMEISPLAVEIIDAAFLGGLATGVPAAGHWAYQKLTQGRETDQANRGLAEAALNQLSGG